MLESRSMDAVTQALREQYKDGSNLNARMRLHARFSTNRYGIFPWILDHMTLTHTLPGDARVLEVGTGTAQMWRRNRDRIPKGWRIVLSDFSDGILRDGLAALAPRGRTTCIDRGNDGNGVLCASRHRGKRRAGVLVGVSWCGTIHESNSCVEEMAGAQAY